MTTNGFLPSTLPKSRHYSLPPPLPPGLFPNLSNITSPRFNSPSHSFRLLVASLPASSACAHMQQAVEAGFSTDEPPSSCPNGPAACIKISHRIRARSDPISLHPSIPTTSMFRSHCPISLRSLAALPSQTARSTGGLRKRRLHRKVWFLVRLVRRGQAV